MDIILLSALAVTVIGSLLGAITTYFAGRQGYKREAGDGQVTAAERVAALTFKTLPAAKVTSGAKVLLYFSAAIAVFATLTAARYWDSIKTNGDLWMFGVWLFLTMVAGMFVQVIAANYRAGKPLFSVSASQLVFPLLFSTIVFYPVWVIGTSAQVNLFSFHAAFLNGYFWESVVSSTHLPVPANQ